jgi:hypothetical protein
MTGNDYRTIGNHIRQNRNQTLACAGGECR